MITTNLPQFVQQLNELATVHVHDANDRIELQISKPVDISQLDDLVCDALFADPVARQENAHGYVIQMDKREHLRGASADMHVINGHHGFMGYVLQPAA